MPSESEKKKKITTVKEILGSGDDLYHAIGQAFRKRIDPALIAKATRARFIGRNMRALQGREMSDAPVLYLDTNGEVQCMEMGKVKAHLTELWDQRAHSRRESYPGNDSYTVRYIVEDLTYMFRPVIGVCILNPHLLLAHPHAVQKARHLINMRDVPRETAAAILSGFGTVQQSHIDAAMPQFGICPDHMRMGCWSCGTSVPTPGLDTETLLSWQEKGCPPCRNQEWLSFIKPPKYSPAAMRSWMTATRQFVDVL